MNKFEVVYANNQTLGYFDGQTYKTYTKEEKEKLLDNINNLLIKKDCNRRIVSLITGLLMLTSIFPM